MAMDITTNLSKTGGRRYENGLVYVGGWNHDGRPEGFGHLQSSDKLRYDGQFKNGLFHGIGVLKFPDGTKYEGNFSEGWFHGLGVFWRSDGMKHEGEYRGGKLWGLGLTTFSDGSNGFPRHEGFFKDCRLVRKTNCPEIIQFAQKIAFTARSLS